MNVITSGQSVLVEQWLWLKEGMLRCVCGNGCSIPFYKIFFVVVLNGGTVHLKVFIQI
jgi:hypothetical protein